MRRATDPTAERPGAFAQVARVVRQVLGAPDYDAYVDHCHRAGHPVALTRRAYIREMQDRKSHAIRCC